MNISFRYPSPNHQLSSHESRPWCIVGLLLSGKASLVDPNLQKLRENRQLHWMIWSSCALFYSFVLQSNLSITESKGRIFFFYWELTPISGASAKKSYWLKNYVFHLSGMNNRNEYIDLLTANFGSSRTCLNATKLELGL